jgi:serine/threonine-protein kinase RsbW
MAAEEAFVYARATRPASCDMTFCITGNSLDMVFSLGDVVPTEDEALAEQVGLAELLLSAVSDSYEVVDRSELRVTKLVGVVHDA